MFLTGVPDMDLALDLHLALCRLPRLNHQRGADAMRDAVFCVAWLVAMDARAQAFSEASSVSAVGAGSSSVAFLLLRELLECAHATGLAQDPSFAYAVRRLVFPAAIRRALRAVQPYASPSHVALDVPDDVGVFDDAASLLNALWRTCRAHLKTEFAVTLRSLVVPGIRDARAPLWLRARLMDLVSSWLSSDRTAPAEVFLNFENDPPVPHWRLFQDLFAAWVGVVEEDQSAVMAAVASLGAGVGMGAGAGTGAGADPSPPTTTTTTTRDRRASSAGADAAASDIRAAHTQLRVSAATTLVSCVRSMVDLAATASALMFGGGDAATSVPHGWELPRLGEGGASGRANARHTEEQHQRELLEKGLAVARAKGVRSAVSFLTASGYVAETPSEVARFLRVNLEELGEVAIGEYLGERGNTEAEQALMEAVRDAFVRSSPRPTTGAGNTTTTSFDASLRWFLTKSGLRVGGEAQKVERLLSAFARAYHADHADPTVFASVDAVLVLAFSVVMLNTDLHRAEIKRGKKMKREEFVRNLRGANDGGDFPREFLEALYESVGRDEIRFEVAGGGASASSSASASAASSEKTDGPAPSFHDDAWTSAERGLGLLTLSKQSFPTYHATLSVETARLMFEATGSRTFHVVSELLERPAESLELVAAALDLLEYAITVTLFLPGLATDRRAFASLLAKLVATQGVELVPSLSSSSASSPDDRRAAFASSATSGAKLSSRDVVSGAYLAQPWFQDLMAFVPESNASDEAARLVACVHTLTERVGERLSAKKAQRRVAEIALRLGLPDLRTDPDRKLVREGRLRSAAVDAGLGATATAATTTTAKQPQMQDFAFFLFSDCLVRASAGALASASAGGEAAPAAPVTGEPTYIVVYDRIPLRTLRVGSGSGAHVGEFEVRSPVKTLVVVARDEREKTEWCMAIQNAQQRVAALVRQMEVEGGIASPKVQARARAQEPPAAPVVAAPQPPAQPEPAKGSAAPPPPTPTLDIKATVRRAKQHVMDPRIGTREKLLLYGLYRQATKGDCPVSLSASDEADAAERAKHHAWRAFAGMSAPDACAALERLLARLESHQASQ